MPAVVSQQFVQGAPATASKRDVAAGKQRLCWVDWLRFLAAVAVMLEHLCASNWTALGDEHDPRYKTLLTILAVPIHLGRVAVIVFFVLSGALVGGLTLRKIRAGAFDAPTYVIDRFARIYVPLVPALLLTATCVRALDGPVYPLQYVGCLLGLNEWVTHHPSAIGPLWSLAYEIWFYILAGCAGILAGWRRRPVVVRCIAATVGAAALVILCFRLDWSCFAGWLLGTAAMSLSERIGPSLRRWAIISGLAVMGMGVVACAPELIALMPLLDAFGRWSGLHSAGNVLSAVGTLILVAGVCRWSPSSRAAAWIEGRGTILAAFSYTMYLTHFPILMVLITLSSQLPDVVTLYSLFRAAAWTAVCVGVALIQYWLFEARTPRFRRWLRARFAGSNVARADVVHGQETFAIRT